jgi:hypothetical protein
LGCVLIVPGSQKAGLNGKPFDEYIKSQLLIYLPKVQSEKSNQMENDHMKHKYSQMT